MFWTKRGPSMDEFNDLKSEVKRLRAEWNDMFERLVRRDDRIRKRQERETESDGAFTPRADVKAALRARLAARGGLNGS